MSRGNVHEEMRSGRMELGQRLKEKLKEAVDAVLPIMVIVLLLFFYCADFPQYYA